jgi:hypothetical protein
MNDIINLMLIAILFILIILWLLGYGPFQVFHTNLFTIRGHVITFWNVLIFLVLIWLIDLLPSPFRQIAAVIFVIWLLASLGFIAIPILSNLLVISIIVGLLLYLLHR